MWTQERKTSNKQRAKGEIRPLPFKHPAYCKGISEYGYFAIEPISENTFIGEYAGRWKYRQKNDKSRYLAKVNLDDATNLDFELDVDADTIGNETRFINSASKDCKLKQNARMETVWSDGFLCIFVYAISFIQPNEEIILDYGNDYFEEELSKTNLKEEEKEII